MKRSAVTLVLACACAHATAACNVSVQSVAFGTYDIFATQPLESAGAIHVRCDMATPHSIALSPGSGSLAQRTMTNAAHVLGYNLFADAARSTVWGDGSAGSATVSGSAANADYVVYARVPARQNAVIGTYGDTLTVTITY